MGAALTYARRYALFTLVGIAARMISTPLTSRPQRNRHQVSKSRGVMESSTAVTSIRANGQTWAEAARTAAGDAR